MQCLYVIYRYTDFWIARLFFQNRTGDRPSYSSTSFYIFIDLLQVPLRAADSRLQFQQGANNLKVNILMIFIFLTIRSGLLTSQSPGPLWRGYSSTSLSPASHWSRFLYGGIIKDNKQLWQIFKDNLTTTNQKKIFYSTWILTQCSWAGANSWLLPVPSQDRGEHFEQSTKSSTRERWPAWSW